MIQRIISGSLTLLLSMNISMAIEREDHSSLHSPLNPHLLSHSLSEGFDQWRGTIRLSQALEAMLAKKSGELEGRSQCDSTEIELTDDCIAPHQGRVLLTAHLKRYFEQWKKRMHGAMMPQLHHAVNGWEAYEWGESFDLSSLLKENTFLQFDEENNRHQLSGQSLGSHRYNGVAIHITLGDDPHVTLFSSMDEEKMPLLLEGVNHHFKERLTLNSGRASAENSTESIEIGPCVNHACSLIYTQKIRVTQWDKMALYSLAPHFFEAITPEKVILNWDYDRDSFKQIGFHLPIESESRITDYLLEHYGEDNDSSHKDERRWISANGEILLTKATGFGAQRGHRYLDLLINEYQALPTPHHSQEIALLIESNHVEWDQSLLMKLEATARARKEEACDDQFSRSPACNEAMFNIRLYREESLIEILNLALDQLFDEYDLKQLQ